MTSRRTFPPYITASKWGTAWQSAFKRALDRRGKDTSAEGTMVPRITNAEAVTLIMAWRQAAGSDARFPLWHQFAAVAYRWNPKTGRLDRTAKNASALYPATLADELWRASFRLASDLDDRADPARLSLDGEYTDPVFQASVVDALAKDGASASFKIPLPACKQPDGTYATPKCKRPMEHWPFLCEEYESCDPLTVDDPLTHAINSAMPWLLVLSVLWFAGKNQQRRRRRTRE